MLQQVKKFLLNILTFLERGVNVVTPNKYANSNDYEYYQHLRKTANLRELIFSMKQMFVRVYL